MPKSITIKKPRPDFPLFPHATGRWAKKVRGSLAYFGKVAADPEGEKALELWLAQRDELLAGRKPRSGKGVSCGDLASAFLAAKELLVQAGEITHAHWFDYKATFARMLRTFGKSTPVDTLHPDDFNRLRAAIAKVYGPTALGNEIQRVRSLFKWGFEAGYSPAVRFGPDFRKPSKKIRRLTRAAAGPKLFSASELHAIIAAASNPLRAMILLGINCGMGQTDVATMPLSRLDLERGWHRYERPKTGIERRCPLWPETIKALRESIKDRPEPKLPEDAELVFITKYGRCWVRLKPEKGAWIDSVGLEFRKLLKALRIKGSGKSFYTLRRTFRTIADQVKDQPAALFIMGHAPDDSDMSATYRQEIGDDRLKAITDHVRKWLFPKSRKPR